MNAITDRGIELLIPPDSSRRKGARPGWQGGVYTAMRERLATDRGAELYRKRQPMIEPVVGQTKFNRRIDRLHRRGRHAARTEWRLSPPPTTSSSSTATASRRRRSEDQSGTAGARGSRFGAHQLTPHRVADALRDSLTRMQHCHTIAFAESFRRSPARSPAGDEDTSVGRAVWA
jgi:hypothetical protein